MNIQISALQHYTGEVASANRSLHWYEGTDGTAVMDGHFQSLLLAVFVCPTGSD